MNSIQWSAVATEDMLKSYLKDSWKDCGASERLTEDDLKKALDRLKDNIAPDSIWRGIDIRTQEVFFSKGFKSDRDTFGKKHKDVPFAIIHPLMRPFYFSRLYAAFVLFNDKSVKVEPLKPAFSIIYPATWNGQGFCKVKQTLIPLQVDEGGRLLTYLDHIFMLNTLEENEIFPLTVGFRDVNGNSREDWLKRFWGIVFSYDQHLIPLTKRQWDIVEAISMGKTREAISQEFDISKLTVEKHYKNILSVVREKLPFDFHSIREFSKWLKAMGYV